MEAPRKSSRITAHADKTTTLLVFRHGETEWNCEKRVQGQTDISLNAEGRQQASLLAETLQRLGAIKDVDAVVSSDLSRASETAEAIYQKCCNAQRRTDARLREFNFGDFQGALASECNGKKEIEKAWAHGDWTRAMPGGESAADVVERGLSALREAADLGSCVVVVSHGGLIKRCGISIALGDIAPSAESMELPHIVELRRAVMPNCSCSTLIYDHGAKSFRSKGWFKTFGENADALDDSG